MIFIEKKLYPIFFSLFQVIFQLKKKESLHQNSPKMLKIRLLWDIEKQFTPDYHNLFNLSIKLIVFRQKFEQIKIETWQKLESQLWSWHRDQGSNEDMRVFMGFKIEKNME